MNADYHGAGWALYHADCVEGMHAMPAQSVDCSVFSPPFGDLFVYSDSERDLGNAGSDDEFTAQYQFFAEALARVMKPGRIACVHCTDLPTRKGKHGYIGLKDFSGDLIKAHTDAGMIYHGRTTIWKDPVVEMQRTKALGLLYKQIRKDSAMNRVGMPDYMLFFRAPGDNPDRIEHAAPEMTPTKEISYYPCTDCNAQYNQWQETCDCCGWPVSRDPVHKTVKTISDAAFSIARKWLEEMRRHGLASQVPDDAALRALLPHVEFDVYEWQQLASPVWMNIQQGNVLNRMKAENDEKHVCPLQLDVIENCLRLYSKPGDVVMDPFNGIGSTGYQAVKMFRRYIGFELKPEYIAQASKNLADAEASASDLFGIAA